jgi:hypothetical protein
MKDKILSEMHNDVDITLLSKKDLLKIKKEIKLEALGYAKDLTKRPHTDDEGSVMWEMICDCEEDIVKIDNHLKTLE